MLPRSLCAFQAAMSSTAVAANRAPRRSAAICSARSSVPEWCRPSQMMPTVGQLGLTTSPGLRWLAAIHAVAA